MPRNYKQELDYERRHYRQLLFKVKVDEAERHREHLAKHDIKPVEWLRYAMSLELVPGVAADGAPRSVPGDDALPAAGPDMSAVDTDIGIGRDGLLDKIADLERRLEVAMKMNAIDNNLELARLKSGIANALKLVYDDYQNSKYKSYSPGLFEIFSVMLNNVFSSLKRLGILLDVNSVDTDISVVGTGFSAKCVRCGFSNKGYVDGYFRCADCEFINYEPVPAFDSDIGIGDCADVDDDHKIIDVCVDEKILAVRPDVAQPKRRKKVMQSPTPEMVAEWHRLHKSGLSFPEIAKDTDYETSTVRKRVRKYESDGVSKRVDAL